MKDERGFALLMALWILVALSVVGMEMAVRARDGRLTTTNVQESARALAAADAGIAHIHLLLDRELLEVGRSDAPRDGPTALDPWARLGSVLPDSQTIDGAVYRVQLRDAGSALHLNRCTEDELRRLLAVLRVDAGEADRIAQAAMDWRDSDHLAPLALFQANPALLGTIRHVLLEGGGRPAARLVREQARCLTPKRRLRFLEERRVLTRLAGERELVRQERALHAGPLSCFRVRGEGGAQNQREQEYGEPQCGTKRERPPVAWRER